MAQMIARTFTVWTFTQRSTNVITEFKISDALTPEEEDENHPLFRGYLATFPVNRTHSVAEQQDLANKLCKYLNERAKQQAMAVELLSL